ncbi:unnamed protein product [Orchesella dallaii]|uniref:IF rod domain-containing protein n=1 Tax=Orchesella dallaii TaxID=48710 RepID=A0ABP1RBN6_9HEXA
MEREEVEKKIAVLIERNQQLEKANKFLLEKDIRNKEAAKRTGERICAIYSKELAERRVNGLELTEEVANLQMNFLSLRLKYEEGKKMLEELRKYVVQKTDKKHEMIDIVLLGRCILLESISGIERLLKEIFDKKVERAEVLRDKRFFMEVVEMKTMSRIEAQKLLQKKDKELKLEAESHEEHVKQLVSSQLDMKKAEEMLRQTYDTKLQETIQGLKKQFEKNLQASVQSLEIQRGAVGSIKAELKKAQHDLHDINVKTMKVKSQLDSLQQKNTEVEKERQELMKTVQNMEHKSYVNHHVFGKMLEEKDSAIETLVAEKEELLNDTQLLMATKLAVDNEIATYRKLMDIAEQQ